MKISLPIHNLKIISFSGIITNKVETKLLNDLDSFNLIKDGSINLKNKDVKRLMYHHVIYELCDYVLSVKGKERIIVLHSTIVPPTAQINKFVHIDDSLDFFNKFVLKIIKMLPIKFIYTTTTFNELKKSIKSKRGTYYDVINQSKDILDNYDITKYTFTKARSFSKRYGLEYLSNNFFQQIKAKQLILS